MRKNPFKDDGFQHYYLRADSGQPYGVVAVAPGEEEGKVHRGIALCSTLDTWDRVAGRRKAVGRVKKAAGCKRSSDAVANDWSDVVHTFLREDAGIFQQPAGTVFKSGYNVTATEKEKVIIENLLKKEVATP